MRLPNLKRFFSFSLSFILCLSVCTPIFGAGASINEATCTAEEQQLTFDALPDDAVVCYVYGQPVYKYEIDENGIILKDFDLSGSITRSTNPTDTIPISHQGHIICASCSLVTIGFSQTENIIYYPHADAIIAARKFYNVAGGVCGSGIWS